MKRLGLMLVGLVFLASCGESDPCSNEGMAEIMAQNFIKRELREPDSARFSNVIVVRHGEGSCEYAVGGVVSARNGFGGMTQSVFSVDLTKERGVNSWRGQNVSIR